MLRLSTSDRQLTDWLRRRYDRLVDELGWGVARAMVLLARYVAEEKLSGQVLKPRTGTLRDAVMNSARAWTTRSTVEGRVSNNAASWYGVVHEEGAVIPEMQGKLMVFRRSQVCANESFSPSQLRGRIPGPPTTTVFTMKRRAFRLPARYFMRRSLREQMNMVLEEIGKALRNE
jgi:hypothetical protein